MLKLEHIGIAVEDASLASLTLKKLFGRVPYKEELLAREGIDTFFIDAGGPKLELLESTAGNSAIAKFVGKSGEGLHHIAVEVDDIEAHFDRVQHEGFTVLSEGPVDGADGKRIFFVHPRDCHGILVEFCQQVRPTWRYAEVQMPHGTVSTYSAGSAEAAPVLLLHDQGSSVNEDFNELLPTLERSMHVIAFDATGHSIHKHAKAVLDSYFIQEGALVIGRGLAAEAAVQMAQSYPELVLALVFIDPEASIVSILEESHLDNPILVCSLKLDSVEAAGEISRRFSQTRLSVIPEIGRRHAQLAEQIVAFGAWI